MAKKVDLKAKAKRQKMIAAVGGVLLLAVMAIQVPRTMKMLNAQAPAPPPAASTTAAPTTGDPSVLPTPGTVGGTTTTPSGGGAEGTLVDSDAAPAPEVGQLVSFGRFESKDPFAQQIDLDPPSGGGGGAAGGGGGSSGESPAKPGESAGGSGGPSAPAGAAVIAINGTEETVAVKADFPKDAPVFTLVSIVNGRAKIAIAGGALASGAPTLTLEKGTPITLVNTADGVRYELKLLSVG